MKRSYFALSLAATTSAIVAAGPLEEAVQSRPAQIAGSAFEQSEEGSESLLGEKAPHAGAFVPTAGIGDDPAVRYSLMFTGGIAQFRDTGFSIRVGSGTGEDAATRHQNGQYRLDDLDSLEDSTISDAAAERMNPTEFSVTFVGANEVEPVGGSPTGAFVNIYRGSDPSQWREGLRCFGELIYPQLYEGIDLHLKMMQDSVFEYDLQVAPGARLEDVEFLYDGVDSLRLDDSGALIATSGSLVLREARPISWQETPSGRKYVDVRFDLRSERAFGFRIHGEYDPEVPLTIDPKILGMGYIGGSSAERGRGIVLDEDKRNLLLVGRTDSPDFMAAKNGFKGGPFDAYVFKTTVKGKPKWTTFVGGTNKDWGRDIVLGDDGSIFIVGLTESDDLPRALNSRAGDKDTFVAKLRQNGTIEWTVHIGGTGSDAGRIIALGKDGYLYASGLAHSNDFPNQINQASGREDVFVTKVSQDGEVFWTLLFGGKLDDRGRGITALANNDIYVHGVTYSDDLLGAINEFQGGEADSFLARITPDGTLHWVKYIGGTGDDLGWDVDYLPRYDELLLVGRTNSLDLPFALNSYFGGEGDGYIMRTDSQGNVLWSTYLGGLDWDEAFHLAITSPDGDAIVCGDTASRDFVARINGYNGALPGQWDGSAVRVLADGSIDWMMYLGGSDTDYAWEVAFDLRSNIYFSGSTFSSDFPDSQNRSFGGTDAWLARMDIDDSDRMVMRGYGVCPGEFSVKITGVTPNSEVTLLWSPTRGSYRIPGGSCGGTELGLSESGLEIIALGVADDTGTAWIDLGFIIPNFCGYQLQAIDFGSCGTTNVLSLR